MSRDWALANQVNRLEYVVVQLQLESLLKLCAAADVNHALLDDRSEGGGH